MKVLIKTYGFFGDILFASSIAERLKFMVGYGVEQVDFLIGFPQMFELIDNNPFIDNVYVSDSPSPLPIHQALDETVYDRVYQLGPLSFHLPPPEEFQRLIGIESPTTTFKVYTTPSVDEYVAETINVIRENLSPDQKILYIPYNWDVKAFRFTKGEYLRGRYQRPRDAEIPKRDIQKILDSLSQQHYIIFGGLPHGNPQNGSDSLQKSLAIEASVIKHVDWYVGPEGGLLNIAGGLGTKTIYNWDWVHHLYGPNGIIKKCDPPMLGPANMFGSETNWAIDPYVTDEELFQNIFNIIRDN
jgi:hypothetical protein